MNERIEKMAEQCRSLYRDGNGGYIEQFDEQKFAELIVQECKENFAKVWYEQGIDVRGAELDKFMKRFEEHFGVEE
jgi:hypothetical protein